MAVLVAVSMGTRPAEWVYWGWPMMKFFRHLGLTTGPVKLFFCFLAGSGLDNLVRRDERSAAPGRRLLCVIPLFALCAFLAMAAGHPASVAGFLGEAPTDISYVVFPPALDIPFVQKTLTLVVAAAFTGTLCIAAWLWSAPGSDKRVLVTLLLGVQLLDLYSYRIGDILAKTFPLSPAERTLTRQQAMPFQKRRVPLFKSDAPRTVAMSRFRFWGAVPESTPLLLFLDEPGSSFRAYYFQRPFDQFLRTYLGLSLSPEEDEDMAYLLFHLRLKLPLGHPAALKISGTTEDKIQFFSRASLAGEESQAVSFMRRPDYTGDSIILLADGIPIPPGSPPSSPEFEPGSDSRLRLPYRVTRFDSNHLALSVEVPGGQPVWMLYSDVWHPAWTAAVNGISVPVYRANLAYKAVPLAPGPNRVGFSFRLPLLSWLQGLFTLNVLVWVGVLTGLLRRANDLTEEGETLGRKEGCG